MRHLIGMVGGWSAAFVLIEAAIAKSFAGVGLANKFASEFGMPIRTTRLLVRSLVVIEVLVFTAILVRPAEGMIGAALLFLGFAAFGISVGHSDRSGLNCGCLGKVVELRLSTETAAPNVALGGWVAISAFAIDPQVRLEARDLLVVAALAAAVSVVFWISYYGLGVAQFAMPESLD